MKDLGERQTIRYFSLRRAGGHALLADYHCRRNLTPNPAREVRISPPAHAQGSGDFRGPAPAGWGFGFFTPLAVTR